MFDIKYIIMGLYDLVESDLQILFVLICFLVVLHLLEEIDFWEHGYGF